MSPSGPAFYAAEVLKERPSASGGSKVDIIHIPTHVLNQAFSRTVLAKSWSTEPHSVALLDLMLRSSGRSGQSEVLPKLSCFLSRLHVWFFYMCHSSTKRWFSVSEF